MSLAADVRWLVCKAQASDSCRLSPLADLPSGQGRSERHRYGTDKESGKWKVESKKYGSKVARKPVAQDVNRPSRYDSRLTEA